MFKIISIALSAMLLYSSSNGQADSGLLKPAQYKADLLFLKQQLQTTYPSLYRFNSETAINKLFDSCYNAIGERTTDIDFYGSIKYIVSYIGDGHLGCSPSPALRQQLESNNTYFPVSLLFTGNKAFVNCSNGNDINKGAEIISINNIPISAIISRLFKYLPSDGSIQSRKIAMLNNAFFFYYSLVYGDPPAFNVQYKEKGVTRSGSFAPTQRKNIQCEVPSFNSGGKLLQLDYPAAGVAALRIQTFSHQDITNAGEDFPEFLDTAFAEIRKKNIKALIIDLRDNGGGADVYGALLYSYLSSRPFKYYEALQTTERALTAADHPNLALQQPDENHFDGKLLVLINGASFSATAEFCSIAKDNKRAVFIGEETGGTYIGNTSGGSNKFALPNTKINMAIPTTRYTMAVKAVKPGDKGIIPDHIVIPSFADVAERNDVQFKYALKLAASLR